MRGPFLVNKLFLPSYPAPPPPVGQTLSTALARVAHGGEGEGRGRARRSHDRRRRGRKDGVRAFTAEPRGGGGTSVAPCPCHCRRPHGTACPTTLHVATTATPGLLPGGPLGEVVQGGRRGGGEGGGVWAPKVCVPKMARSDFPNGKFRFFTRWSLGSGGGGGGQGLGGWLCWPVAAPIGLSPLTLLL